MTTAKGFNLLDEFARDVKLSLVVNCGFYAGRGRGISVEFFDPGTWETIIYVRKVETPEEAIESCLYQLRERGEPNAKWEMIMRKKDGK